MGLYQTLWSTNKSYREKHTYIEDVFDCDDMTIDLWNLLYKQGMTSAIVAGNLDMNNEKLRECDHTWLVIIHRGEDALYQLFAIESTNGEVYAYDKNTRAFEQYFQGYYYSSPSDFKEDTEWR